MYGLGLKSRDYCFSPQEGKLRGWETLSWTIHHHVRDVADPTTNTSRYVHTWKWQWKKNIHIENPMNTERSSASNRRCGYERNMLHSQSWFQLDVVKVCLHQGWLRVTAKTVEVLVVDHWVIDYLRDVAEKRIRPWIKHSFDLYRRTSHKGD